MKMILALNNRVIEEKLVKKYYSSYDIYLANSTDIIFSLLKEDKESVVVVRENLKGKIDFKQLISMLKDYSKDIRVIALVKSLSQELKEFLLSKEVFNIIEGVKFNFEDLVDLIDNPRMVIYKQIKNDSKKCKVICVTGSKAVGKTITALTISNILAKDKNKKVVLIDLDFIYPTMDTYLDAPKNYSLNDYIKDLKSNSLKNINSYETIDLRYSNLKYILNAKCIPIPNNDTIVLLIENLKKYYDFVIVDSSTIMMNKIYTISQSKGYSILHIIEPGKKAFKEFLLDTMYIDKKLILSSYIVCNKVYFINKLKEMTKQFNINGYIKFNLLLSYKSKYNYRYIRSNFKSILKELKVSKFRSIKKTIIEKVLKYKEENNE